MVKYYCDLCGKRTERDYAHQVYQPELRVSGDNPRKLKFYCQLQVTVAEMIIDGDCRTGQLCLKCLTKVFQAGEPKVNVVPLK